ncbi:MAG: glutathione S-transferase family protein [Proteobacteria bacterium]|nr:glutathione S-transferase family protein [Pseudomonadota bacterium]
MNHEIRLYGAGFARSARCRWTLQELGMDFEEISAAKMIGGDELREFHPQSKVPAIVIDGERLFESSAICTYLCDISPDQRLIAASGTRERALHDQWVSFGLSEMEGYLWSNAKHTGFYPEEKRVTAVVERNTEEFRKGAAVLDNALSETPFLVGGNFSVTDIILGWTVNWARRMGHLGDFPNLQSYLDRLFAREHCALNPE